MEGERKRNNGKRHPQIIKKKAQKLRGQGWTHREIASHLKISSSSAHLWTRAIVLTDQQRQAIQARKNKRIFTARDRQEIRERLAPYRTKYSKQDLLDKIIRFYRQHSRIPLKREFNSLRVYRTHFGSWNNAIRLAGFTPNTELFTKKTVARDGHICDSFAEKIIDDWLSERKIAHTKNCFYKGTKLTADFYIEDQQIYIEFFGLHGANKKYDRNVARKLFLAKQRGLNLIALYPTDIQKFNLSQRLAPLVIPR